MSVSKEVIVKKIHKSKVNDGETLYLVEWEDGDQSWEPFENLYDCSIFKDFIENKPSKKRKRDDTGMMIKDIFKKTNRETLSKDERFDIIREQAYRCNLCLNRFGSSTFEIDHIISLEQGGTNDLSNLQALCDSCHIYKTTVLDRGVITRLLQAKIKNGKSSSITRNEILEECQMVFANRNRNTPPFHDEQMLNFCVSTVDIFREMCKKKVKDILSNNMSQIDFKIKPSNIDTKESLPPEPVIGKSKYLNDMVLLLNQLMTLNIENNVINMNNFTLNIKIDKNKKRMVDKDIYENLNNFFKYIHEKKPRQYEKDIGNIKIKYTPN